MDVESINVSKMINRYAKIN